MRNYRIRSAAAGSVALLALLLTACDTTEETTQDSAAAADETVDQQDQEEPASESQEAEEGGAEADPAVEASEDTDEEASADAGSRDNPLPLGETVEHADWSVTINSFTSNADEEVAAANQFNDPAPEGSTYALINADATYHGGESEMVMIGVSVDYVTASGETIDSADSMATAPDALDISAELFEGGTESGNIVLAVPEDAEGLIRVRLGMFDQQDTFFATE